MRSCNYIQRLLIVIFASSVWCNPTMPSNKIPTQEDACKLVSHFAPNFCRLSSSMQYCQDFCLKRSNLNEVTCGKKTTKRRRFRRIVGGKESQQGQWPWHVSLRLNGTQQCSAAILSERYVLTAFHCFRLESTIGSTAKDWKVIAGDHNLKVEEDFEQEIQVKRLFLHPEFNFSIYRQERGIYGTAIADVAVMELEEPINLNDDNKGTLCLPEEEQPNETIRRCYVAGWGHTEYNGTQPDILRHAKVLTVPTPICNLPNVYNETIDSKELICAGFEEGGVDACRFDSGGAMACLKEGRWYESGIVSSGLKCALPNAYGLYTRVATYKNWIVETIIKAEMDH